MLKDINRQVHFAFAPPFDPEDTSGINNTWIYIRAPDGYLFLLDSMSISTSTEESERNGIVALYDGHEYTHWHQFPGVESRELLYRTQLSNYQLTDFCTLNNWKCKEYTIGIRSTANAVGIKVCAIMWYYLEKASREELLEYALKHPKDEDAFKRGLRGTTVEPEEA